MNIGFIGAGKVGFSLGKYLTERGVCVTGYYSLHAQSSQQAAEFTNTRQYLRLQGLVQDSDVLFLTVSDGKITAVWDRLRQLPIQGKAIIHCSGLLSSAVFSEIERVHAFGYSIHPLLAINDKYTSYEKLSGAFFAMEGHEQFLEDFRALFAGFGNTVGILSAEDKVRYHAAAAMASNLYVGLSYLSEQLLCECGFSKEEAHSALAPLILGNAENIARNGPVAALTGPIERNDETTVSAHLSALPKETADIYRLLSAQVVEVARKKHPTRDYDSIESLLSCAG